MKVDRWITAEQACADLHIKRQTLYAYVSRGLIETAADNDDPRRSLYSAIDVTQLKSRNRRPRARAAVASEAISWGEPVLESAITSVRNGELYFGEKNATSCADSLTLEEVCDYHFGTTSNPLSASAAPIVKGRTPKARAYRFLSDLATNSLQSSGRANNALATEAQRLMSDFANAMIGDNATGFIHERLASHWGVKKAASELIRSSLVLMSDHELNASTFAVRVCASTGAPLPSCILAGLSTLDGPLHGEASTEGLRYLRDAMSEKSLPKTIQTHIRSDGSLAGFGHPLYPAGDPRSHYILSQFPKRSRVQKIVMRTTSHLGHFPSADLALAAMAIEYELPDEAPFMIFAIARVSGWLAHAAEQIQSGKLIRPRARYRPRVT